MIGFVLSVRLGAFLLVAFDCLGGLAGLLSIMLQMLTRRFQGDALIAEILLGRQKFFFLRLNSGRFRLYANGLCLDFPRLFVELSPAFFELALQLVDLGPLFGKGRLLLMLALERRFNLLLALGDRRFARLDLRFALLQFLHSPL